MLKRIFFAAVVALGVVALAAPADAQQRQRGPGGGMGGNLDEQMAQLTEVLELDEEQATAVRGVLELQSERMMEMRQGGGGDRESMRAAMMEIMEETDLQLAEILTEDQMGKYREHVQEQRQRRRPPF